MPIAPTLQKYLASKNIEYDVIAHQPTMSSTRTAEACHISGDRLAKAVVLHDGNGYVLAVVPASHHLRLSELSTQLGTKLDLASEREIEQLFADCAQGAIPPVGECYGLDVIVDELVPILRRRGLYRHEYETETVREHFQAASPTPSF